MPISKHHTKKQSNSKRRKISNSRKALNKYIDSPKRVPERKTMSIPEQNDKLIKQFPNLRKIIK